MGLVKVLIFIIKMKIFHFGEIYRLISFHYFINKQEIDISELRVLDVGFNKGVFRWYFKDVLKCSNYSGVEIDKNYLNIYPNTFYHDFEKNKLNKSYDFIFCSHVLEHINNDYKFLNNVMQCLDNENSKLLLRVPIPTDKKSYFRVFNSKVHDDDEHVRDGYTVNELNGLFSNVGLKAEKYFYSMGSLSLAIHTFFEIIRDYQIRFHRLLQLPYILLSMIDIYLLNNTSKSDLLVLALRLPKKEPS